MSVRAMLVRLLVVLANLPTPSIFTFQNWGCVHYVGKYSSFEHKCTTLAWTSGSLKLNPDMTIIGITIEFSSFLTIVISRLHCIYIAPRKRFKVSMSCKSALLKRCENNIPSSYIEPKAKSARTPWWPVSGDILCNVLNLLRKMQPHWSYSN